MFGKKNEDEDLKEAINSSKLTAIESKLLEGEVIYTTPLFKSQNDLDLAYPSTPSN